MFVDLAYRLRNNRLLRFCCYEKHERKTKRRLFCGANCTNEQAEYSGATIDAGVNKRINVLR